MCDLLMHIIPYSPTIQTEAFKEIEIHKFFPDLTTSWIFSWTRLCFRPSCSHARVVSDASKSFGWRKCTFCI